VEHALEDRGWLDNERAIRFKKTKAHRSLSQARADPEDPPFHWAGNHSADAAAKSLLEAQGNHIRDLACEDDVRLQHYRHMIVCNCRERALLAHTPRDGGCVAGVAGKESTMNCLGNWVAIRSRGAAPLCGALGAWQQLQKIMEFAGSGEKNAMAGQFSRHQ
jgi:hypothetical protein